MLGNTYGVGDGSVFFVLIWGVISGNFVSMEDDILTFTDEKWAELESLAACGYSNKEMALYFDIPEDHFIAAADNPDNPVNYHIRRGILVHKAREQIGLMADAQGGNVKAVRTLASLRYRRDFNVARREILYNCEINDDLLHRLESYIESGSLGELKSDEALYIEVLTLMNNMRRKYGRTATIKFFCKAPFNFSYAQARDAFEHAINLFYLDSKVEKKALRNLKAQQLEDAADMVLAVAKEPADFEIYGKLIKLSAEIKQLNLPDPPEVPQGTFDRPYKVYTLDPALIGIEKPDRNQLARQIDSITGATEAEKQKAKFEAGVIDVIPFEDMLDEYEEENKSEEF